MKKIMGNEGEFDEDLEEEEDMGDEELEFLDDY